MNTPSIRLRALVLPLAMALVFLLLLAQRVQAGSGLIPTEPYRVTSGDTLWDVATDYTVAGGDVRETVELIQRASGIDTALVRPGQVLQVPSELIDP